MKKVIIEFTRTDDGTQNYRVFREGEKSRAKTFSSWFLTRKYAGELYASQAVGVRGIAA